MSIESDHYTCIESDHYTWDWSYPIQIAPEWNKICEQFQLGARAPQDSIDQALFQILQEPGAFPAIRRLGNTIYGDDNLRCRFLSCWLKLEVFQRRGYPFDYSQPRTNPKGEIQIDHNESSCVHIAAKDRVIMRAIRASRKLATRSLPNQTGPWILYSEEWLTGDLKRAIAGLARREKTQEAIDPVRLKDVRDELQNPSRLRGTLGITEITELHCRAYEAYVQAGDDLTPAQETELARQFQLTREELIAAVRAIIVTKSHNKTQTRKPE